MHEKYFNGEFNARSTPCMGLDEGPEQSYGPLGCFDCYCCCCFVFPKIFLLGERWRSWNNFLRKAVSCLTARQNPRCGENPAQKFLSSSDEMSDWRIFFVLKKLMSSKRLVVFTCLIVCCSCVFARFSWVPLPKCKKKQQKKKNLQLKRSCISLFDFGQ